MRGGAFVVPGRSPSWLSSPLGLRCGPATCPGSGRPRSPRRAAPRPAGPGPCRRAITSRAATFCSRYSTLVVPGIGTTSSPRASTQARASWLAVTPLSSAISRTRSTSSRLRAKFSPWKRGWLRRRSSGARSSMLRKRPDRKPRPSGRVGDEADAQLADRVEDPVLLDVAGPQRPLGLHRGDRVHGVRPADRRGRGLGDAEVADLAGRDDLGQGAPGLLDGRVAVDAVLVVEVDVVHAEPPERVVDGLADVLRTAVDAAATAVLAAHVAELGRQLHLVAAAGDRPAHELLVGERPVHVGGVQEGHAEVEGAVDRRGRAGPRRRPP